MDVLFGNFALALSGPLLQGMVPCPEDAAARTCYWNMGLVWPLMGGLRLIADTLGNNAGLSIILFTIVIRVVMIPLTLQQIRSQKAMQKLQPEIKAMQKRFAGDREKISAETMALYKQHGVNPAMGCLPLALQMPVLFALYAALNNLGAHDAVFQEPWLWLQGLHRPDVFQISSVTLPGVLPILSAVTQWVQQRMMTPQTDDPQQRMQNQMMQFMPLMMLWIGLSVSSGLALYWVAQNVFGIGQQYFSTGWGSLAAVLPSWIRSRSAGTAGLSGAVDGRAARPAASGREAGSGPTRGDGRAGRGGGNGRDGGQPRRAKKERRRANGKR